MKNQYFKFLYKATLIALPFIFLFLLYIFLDPFKVIKKYNTYYQSGYPSYVTLDVDYVNTQTFINNNPKYNYNAFIFGNSRSRFFEINTWKKYISTDNCFHFDASDETLLGITRKFKYLNNNHVPISHALIILDYSTLNQIEEKKGHLFINHPALSNQNWFLFQLEFFKSFLAPDFLRAYLDFKFNNKVKDYMKNDFLLNDAPIDYNNKYNEMRFSNFEEIIKRNPSEFYNESKMKLFYSRDSIQRYLPEVIKDSQLLMLNEMSDILKKNGTNFKIIINPLYDQLKINIKDIEILKNVFGKQNVFDFSGINIITNDFHNYYENSHYRPQVANSIMKNIYE